MPTVQDLFNEYRRLIPQLSASQLAAERSKWLVIDCRENEELAAGIIAGSSCIPKGKLELEIEALTSDRDRKIVIYCASGYRSTFAGKVLQDLGYRNVFSLQDGIKSWMDSGFLLQTPLQNRGVNLARYGSQIRLKEVGLEGQRKLQEAKVLVVGAGGLGSPVILYLTAAGIGLLGIIDDDRVEESNLQRQLLHTTDRIGLAKVDSAHVALKALNPEIKVITHRERLNAENAAQVLNEYDLVVDCSDNFTTRYLMNDVCVKLGKPNIYGSVFQFQGQVSVFGLPDGPCFRCLFPVPPIGAQAPDCTEGGVMGVLPGVIGCLQANEALKIILSIGDTLSGRLLLFDGKSAKFNEFNLRKDPACCVCSISSIEIQIKAGREPCAL